jgi:uncharacterized membrane protein
MNSTRPKLKPTLSQSDKIIEALGWLALFTLWSLVLFSYSKLPETIAIHFDAYGNPDNYGGKITIFSLPIIASVLFLGLSYLNRFPHIFNYMTEINDNNALQQYSIAGRLVRMLKLCIVLIFTLIAFSTMNVTDKTGNWSMPLLVLGLTLFPVLYYLIQSNKKNKVKGN